MALMAASAPAQTPDTTRADTLPRATLPPLTVSATRSVGDPARWPFGVATVFGDEIRRGRATLGLDEALVTVPGVLAANRYNYALDQRISIRGFGARSAFGVRGVKILIDGIPQTLPDGQGQLTNLELSDAERIEVLRGGASALFGNASGGVISIRTRLGAPERVTPGARVRVGSHGLFKWHASMTAPNGDGAVQASVSRTVIGGFREHSRAELRHVSVRVAQPVGAATQLSLTARADDDPTLENPGALTRAELDAAPGSADPRNVAADAGKAVSQAQIGLALRHSPSPDHAVEVAVFGVRRDLENPLAFAQIGLDRWAYGMRSSAVLPIPVAAGGDLTLGLDAQWQHDARENYTPDGATLELDQIDRVNELGPFARARLAVGAGVSVSAGARFDQVRFEVNDRFTDDGDQSGDRTLRAVSWTGGVTVDRGTAVRPYLGVATSFETPTTTEFINRPDGQPGLNPDLEPQRALHVELGVRGVLERWGVDYEVAGFWVDVDDELVSVESPVQPGRTVFRNAGSATHRGVEVSASALVLPRLRAVLAYTLADYRFDEFVSDGNTLDGNRLPGIPVHRAHVSLRYYDPSGLWAAWDQTLSSSLYADDLNTATAAGFALSTLRVGWDGALGPWQISAFGVVENLLDDQYVSSVVVNAFGGRFYEPGVGRAFVVGAEIGGW